MSFNDKKLSKASSINPNKIYNIFDYWKYYSFGTDIKNLKIKQSKYFQPILWRKNVSYNVVKYSNSLKMNELKSWIIIWRDSIIISKLTKWRCATK